MFSVAMDGKMASNESNTLWTVGAGFLAKIDDGTALRMKFDKNMQLGTSLQLAVNQNARLTLGFSLDFLNFSGGGHKVGFGLELNG